MLYIALPMGDEGKKKHAAQSICSSYYQIKKQKNNEQKERCISLFVGIGRKGKEELVLLHETTTKLLFFLSHKPLLHFHFNQNLLFSTIHVHLFHYNIFMLHFFFNHSEPKPSCTNSITYKITITSNKSHINY